MKLTKALALGAGTVLIASLAVGVYADPDMAGGMGPMGSGGPMGHGAMEHGMGMDHGMMREHFGAQHAGMMEGRLDALKSELKLTPDQVPAWEKFENTATKQRAAMKEVHSAARSTPQSAPERMALHIELMEQRLAGMQEMSAALNGLYDVLTPAQKTIIDQGVGPMAGRHAAHLASHR